MISRNGLVPFFAIGVDVTAEIEALELVLQFRDEPQVHRIVPPLSKLALLQLEVKLLMLGVFEQLRDL